MPLEINKLANIAIRAPQTKFAVILSLPLMQAYIVKTITVSVRMAHPHRIAFVFLSIIITSTTILYHIFHNLTNTMLLYIVKHSNLLSLAEKYIREDI